jgi:hypothetical protein
MGGIEKLEELDKFAAAMAILDRGMDFAGEQINPGQQAERAVALVFIVARKGRVHTGLGRQVRRRRCDRLDGSTTKKSLTQLAQETY